MIRFGKSAAALLAHKTHFFQENDRLLREGRQIASIYAAQDCRRRCKCCDGPLGEPSFRKQMIDYVLCRRCGHWNGAFEDSDLFCAAVYTDARGAAYAKAYSAADRDAYWRRVRDIYVPKAEFLRDALKERETPADLAYADFGAGSGYFVAALRETGLARAHGVEVSATQIALADAMLGEGAVRPCALERSVALAASIEADVVSMVGVLEHVREPREILGALRANRRVRYLFISVPLFSPCVFFEMVFPEVFQRHLSGGHTHLFTERSLAWMAREFGMESVAEWWFGTDMVDLFRAVTVELQRAEALAGAGALWAENFAPAIDELQLVLDKRKLASEVHMLLRFVD